MSRRRSSQPGLEVAFDSDEKPRIQITYARDAETVTPRGFSAQREHHLSSGGIETYHEHLEFSPSFPPPPFDYSPAVTNWSPVSHLTGTPVTGTPVSPFSPSDQLSQLPIAQTARRQQHQNAYLNPRYVPPVTPTLASPVREFGNTSYRDRPLPPREKRKICGLRPVTFKLVLGLLFILLGAGIGGGVAGTIAVRNAVTNAQTAANVPVSTVTVTAGQTASIRTPVITRTPTTTTPSSTTISVPTAGTLAIDCPALTKTVLSVSLGSASSTFDLTCGRDFLPPSSNISVDIIGTISYSLKDCAQACLVYNKDMGSTACKAVVWNSDLTTSLATSYANCFLKNDTSGLADSNDNKYVGVQLVL